MSSLFAAFDPNPLNFLPLNWAILPMLISIIPVNYWPIKNQFMKTFSLSLLYSHLEFIAILSFRTTPGNTLIPLSLFSLLFLVNILGLLPYLFPASSHLAFSMALALPLWLGHMSYSCYTQHNYMLAHLVPLGTPMVLLPFMVVIELISSVIRPLTLSVRLAANIIAGHLLLTLISQNSPASSFWVVIFLITQATMLMSILETAVAMIQAYVFSVLSTLYISEVQTKTISLDI